MNTMTDQLRLRKLRRLLVTACVTAFLAAGFVYAMFFYDITAGMNRKPTPSPNHTMNARVVHYWGDASEIRLETQGIHPFRYGSDAVYPYSGADGWVSGLSWRDDHTLVVTFCFHRRHPALPQRRWRDVTILFQEDACAKAPL